MGPSWFSESHWQKSNELPWEQVQGPSEQGLLQMLCLYCDWPLLKCLALNLLGPVRNSRLHLSLVAHQACTVKAHQLNGTLNGIWGSNVATTTSSCLHFSQASIYSLVDWGQPLAWVQSKAQTHTSGTETRHLNHSAAIPQQLSNYLSEIPLPPSPCMVPYGLAHNIIWNTQNWLSSPGRAGSGS